MLRRVLLLALAPLLSAQTTTGMVEGTVINSITTLGVSGVAVTLRATARTPHGSVNMLNGSGKSYTASTDLSGAFRITGVADGDYQLFLSAEAYNMGAIKAHQSDHFTVHGNTVRLSFELVPFGRLRGRVIDGQGLPVPKARVTLAPWPGVNSSRVTTDKDGRFEVSGSGSFSLMAQPAEGMEPPPQPPSGEQRTAWVPTYFPGTILRADAQRIVLLSGADQDGYEIRLRAAPVYKVRGIVLNDTGKPAPGIPVKLVAPDRQNGEPEAQATSGKDGVFEFPSVWPRDWYFQARIDRDAADLKGFASTLVSRTDVDGVAIRLSPPFSVNASVEFVGSRREKVDEMLGIALFPETAEASPEGEGHPDGSIRIEGVYPGRYRIGVFSSLTPGYYLDSVLLAGRDVTGQTVELLSGSAPIRVIFRPNPGRVTGTVDDCNGQAVVLWQLDDPIITFRWSESQQCNAEGHFDFTDLRPGDYYAYAFATVDDPFFLSNVDFARSLKPRATRVHVNPGETTNIELKLAPWPE